jgi:DNA-binding YbaB/EbfC family protein
MAKGKGARVSLGGGGVTGRVQQLRERLEAVQAALAEETVEASTGGGAVRVRMNGMQECRGVEIDPKLLVDADAQMLQDLIVLAVNQALRESREMADQRLGPLAAELGGMGLGR